MLDIFLSDCQTPSLQHGAQSGPLSLARAWYLICEIQIKHTLLAVLSSPKIIYVLIFMLIHYPQNYHKTKRV
jgi:hypothetical protein